MTKKLFLGLLIPGLFLVLLTRSPANAASGEVITVAAASSFSFALTEIAEDFSSARSNHPAVRLVFGSSGILSRQIERGAPFDVFISANSVFMDELARSNSLRADSVRPFARGRIVLAMLASSGVDVTNPGALSGGGIKKVAIANPLHAPYGRAAVEAMKSAGVWEEVRKKLVYGESVRQTLQFVESGNVDAAIIALSVAKREGIRAVPIDAALHGPILQTAAVLRATTHQKASEEFIQYLTGPQGMLVLEKYGYTSP
ncbi:MAG: molybdate ABC transporter substrate-binding protein [Thermodesulfobacteriota bacterium]